MTDPDYDEASDLSMKRPHIVILGAGASLASFPDGDIDGNILPVMDNLIEVIGIGSILDSMEIPHTQRNFEEVYSELHKRGNEQDLVVIEKQIEFYFSQMRLPYKPTLYDHLVLSLRKKDVIATFNWDPFLFLALQRNHRKGEMPNAVFLHGNVAIGVCEEDRKFGPRGTPCPTCGTAFKAVRLLYPVREKNYTSAPFIRSQWEFLQIILKSAYMLTIFGYGAPESDAEAIALMQQAWGKAEERNLEEIELIDTRSEEELLKTWESFIHTHHYRVFDDFYKSTIANHPRRSCEAMWQQFMEVRFLDQHPIPKSADWSELERWLKPRIDAEKGLA